MRDSKKDSLIHQRFGRLVIIERAEDQWTPKRKRIIRYKCKCDCGNVKEVAKWHLTSGKIVSCGCYKHERQVETNIKHGGTGTHLYNIWCGIKERCADTSNPLYGGKGVSICTEWEHDFKSFADWSYAHGYARNLSIDRIDNSKGYSPDNCRWTTFKVQANNTSKNHYVTIDGETHTLSEWCDIKGLNYATIKCRIYRQKWDDVKAITTPVISKGKKK